MAGCSSDLKLAGLIGAAIVIDGGDHGIYSYRRLRAEAPLVLRAKPHRFDRPMAGSFLAAPEYPRMTLTKVLIGRSVFAAAGRHGQANRSHAVQGSANHEV